MRSSDVRSSLPPDPRLVRSPFDIEGRGDRTSIMKYLTAGEARSFAEQWLPAWTGNDPERLASFYSDDVFYLDPAIPRGVRGKAALTRYFRKLLAYNPEWVWTHVDGIPLEDGFLNKWRATIPVGSRRLEVDGV